MTSPRFGPVLRAEDRLERHLSRIGARQAVDTDPVTSVTCRLVRDVLRIVECALADAGIDEETAVGVFDRIVYGAAPMPSHVDVHQQVLADFTELAASARPPMKWPPR